MPKENYRGQETGCRSTLPLGKERVGEEKLLRKAKSKADKENRESPFMGKAGPAEFCAYKAVCMPTGLLM